MYYFKVVGLKLAVYTVDHQFRGVFTLKECMDLGYIMPEFA